MDPNTLRERVTQAIWDRIVWDSWERCELAEAATVESLTTVMGEWVRILQAHPG